MPFIGKVKINEYSLDQAQQVLEKEIKEYYKYNQVIRPDLGFNGGVRYSDLKWKGLKSGTYFIYQTDLGLEYNRFGTGSFIDKDETVSKYDFVQIAFQRKIKK